MAINYPTSLDSFPNPTSTDLLENATTALDHDVQHSNANDAIEALEAKVGINSSAVTTSHDYKLSAVTSSEKALTSGTSTQSVTDLTLVTPLISFGSDATGDMIYRNGSGETARLPIGTDGQILEVSATGIPEWVDNPAVSDASYTTKGVLKGLTDAATSGLTISSGVISVNSGTSANNIVKLDSSARLPAVDGSQLTNISNTLNNIFAQRITYSQTGTPSISYATTSYLGASTSNAIYAVSQDGAGANANEITRYIKLNNGSLVKTHRIISGLPSGGNMGSICVIGNYLYLLCNNTGSPVLGRYNAADLTGETTMTVSGTAFTVSTSIFTDGTNLYNMYTAGTARIYTISGTTATSGSTVSYTSSGTQYGYWSDGTYLYGIDTVNTYKWAIGGGARTTGTVLFSEQYGYSGTLQTVGGGIFKEVGNTSQILTCLVNKTTNPIGSIIPVTTF